MSWPPIDLSTVATTGKEAGAREGSSSPAEGDGKETADNTKAEESNKEADDETSQRARKRQHSESQRQESTPDE